MNRAFFARDAVIVARELLGMILVHESREGTTVGIIVETEAYTEDDPASHSFRGQTRRNAAMFGAPGTAYVYFTYGMHYCFNVVTGQKGTGEAVLIRSLQPVEGIDIMKRRRGNNAKDISNGPAKLVQAMGIGAEHNGQDLLTGALRIVQGTPPRNVRTATRVGISKGVARKRRFIVA